MSGYPRQLWQVILAYCAMIDSYKKLVAVAEDMAAEMAEAHGSLEGISIEVEGDMGVVRLGVFGIVGSSYSPDDNVVFPEYGVVYKSIPFRWDGKSWKQAVRETVMCDTPEAEEWDELPF